jgi:hypothetical protein
MNKITRFVSTSISAESGATVNFTADCNLAFGAGNSINLADGASSLVINPAARIDMLTSALVIDYVSTSPLGGWAPAGYTGILGLIASGRNGGTWNGPGIRSSFASGDLLTVGAAEASAVVGAGGGGWQGYGVDGTTVLISYAYGGDANLDRTVDLTDFTLLAANFNQSGKIFSQGNFNYDASGIVDLTDFTLLAAKFNQMLPGAARAQREVRGAGLTEGGPAANLTQTNIDILTSVSAEQ